MAYNGIRPADNDPLNISAGIIRDNFEGLRKDGIVIAKPPLYGAGAPSATLGEVGERYFDTATGDQYLKTASGWTLMLSMAVKADQAALDSLAAEIAGLGDVSGEAVQSLSGQNIIINPENGSVIFGTFTSYNFNTVWINQDLQPKPIYFLTLIIANGGGRTMAWAVGKNATKYINWPAGKFPQLLESGIDIVSLFTYDYGATWFGAHWGSFAS